MLPTNLSAYIANSRKAIIQFLGLVITLGTAVLTFSGLPDKYAAIITSVVGAAVTVLHYITANAPAPGTVKAAEVEAVDVDGDEDLPSFSDEDLVTTVHSDDTEPPANIIPELETVSLGKHEAPESTT